MTSSVGLKQAKRQILYIVLSSAVPNYHFNKDIKFGSQPFPKVSFKKGVKNIIFHQFAVKVTNNGKIIALLTKQVLDSPQGCWYLHASVGSCWALSLGGDL